MAYRNLRDFIRKLDKAGELKRIKAEVDVDLEITEITDRVSKSVGPALLFEKLPTAYRNPSALRFSSPQRIRHTGRNQPSGFAFAHEPGA